MAKLYSVALSKLIEDLKLETVYMPRDPQEIMIKTVDINRPGLQLCGFYDYFDSNRIQMFGLGEFAYMEKYTPQERQEFLDKFFSQNIPAVIITRNLEIPEEMVTAANTYEVPLLRTAQHTCDFMSTMIATLKVDLAPRIPRHGVLVEVYGEGILLLGESGVGKSETAIELIKRGHRLIADDAVEIRRVSDKTLVGSSPANIRHFMELRGVGIINARRIFGMGSVKMTEKVDMVISLEQWDKTKVYDRMGMNDEYTEILGIKVPSLTIPVKTGRNLAIIIEVAAMNNRQKKMGYNAAQELLKQLGMVEDIPADALNNAPDYNAY